jgi:hypothetical protein
LVQLTTNLRQAIIAGELAAFADSFRRSYQKHRPEGL